MISTKIIPWASHYLLSHGYTLKNEQPETVQSTPWSYIVRFETNQGYIYLKHTPHLLALEAPITQILHDQFHASVPDIIAHNIELDCFLMKDAGTPLRQILKNQFNTELLCKAIELFTSLQLAVADHVNTFLDIGVPDWRLDKLTDLFQQLLLQKDMLIADGLSEKEISELKLLLPKVNNLCQKLLGYAIKPSLVQCDFHDNNLLVNETMQKITMIDLGEIVISHPFFSLIGCLRQTKVHHGLNDEDIAYQQLFEACFKNYLAVESKQNVLDIFKLAEVLWYVYEALAQYRLRLACDEAKFMAFQRQGKLSGRLKEFLAIFTHAIPYNAAAH
ncbi:MAG TPA: phosphotransferase [Gammaproteobacteria bacterium]|nr:phosphotransferase [Gammaproteobacteria bacterium]